MKTIKRNGLLLLVTLLLCSCQTMGFYSSRDLMAIEKGMSQEEVYKRFRHPDYRNFMDNEEEWEYIMADGKRMRITFYNKKVIAMETYRFIQPAICPPPAPHPHH